jgi:hypothetical protein
LAYGLCKKEIESLHDSMGFVVDGGKGFCT